MIMDSEYPDPYLSNFSSSNYLRRDPRLTFFSTENSYRYAVVVDPLAKVVISFYRAVMIMMMTTSINLLI